MEQKVFSKTRIKRIMHVFNPLAGKGRAKKIKEDLKDNNYVYMSSSPEEATNFIISECRENPDTCFTVYGGDGTVFKAVNALMNSGCNETTSLKIVPVGSGNDFVKSFDGNPGEHVIDLMKFDNRYAANLINMGFDCAVVARAAKMRNNPLILGKFAYILGVVGELTNKKSMNTRISITYADGTTEEIEEKTLLIAIANGRWYGGGFQAAPAAKTDDGLLDVLIVKDIATSTFIKLVGDYKKGTHVNPETGEVIDKFKEFLLYKKCVGIKVEGIESFCADGEIFIENSVEVSVVPHAINFISE